MSSSHAIPTIDIGPFLDGDAAGKRAIAAEVAEVCARVGFLIISGHRFPDELLATSGGRPKFYDPPERGFERDIVKRLAYWDALRKKRGN